MGVSAQAPAFPGAEGHGRYVTGGRGGEVVHVTNLNDSGTGSFRQAVSGTSAKIVVFDVAGVIALSSDVSIGANTTILGQTAPYPGITFRYYTLRPNGSNIIIRFIRSRRGEEKDVDDGADCIWCRKLTGIIIDHCSFSWSIDEVASFYDNNNFTLQWCTIAESLTNPGHSKGAHGYGGIWGGKLASFHHNMIAHVTNRSPRFNGARYQWSGYTSNKEYDTYNWENYVAAENVDFRNCLIYNSQGGCYGGPGGGQINIVNNYYKAGPSGKSSQERVTTVTVGASGNSTPSDMYGMTSRYYISGNTTETSSGTVKESRDWDGVEYDSGTVTQDGLRYSKDPSGYYAAYVSSDEMITYNEEAYVQIKMTSEAPTGDVTTHTAANAYDKILDYAGASLFRDDVDARYMTEAETGTATYTGSVTGQQGLVDYVSDVEGYTEDNFPTGSRDEDFDTDNDGMADAWETANGLDPTDASDALTYTLDEKGYYTNLEVYANHLVQELVEASNADATDAVDEYWPTVNKVESLEYYTGREVELVEILESQSEGTITWSFDNGLSTDEAVVSDDLADYIESTTFTYGSNFTEAAKAINGSTFLSLSVTDEETAAASSNQVSFGVTTIEDYYFVPTQVTFKMARVGTDSGVFDLVWNAASSTTVLSGVQPNRNNSDGGWWSEYDETLDISDHSTTSSLDFYIYTLGAGKAFALRDVVITGDLMTSAVGNAVSHIADDVEVVDIRYYNLAGQQLSAPQRGVNIVWQLLSNGQSIAQKIVVE